MADRIEKPYQRRKYLIDKKFQVNFIFRFSLLVLAGGFITVSIVYLLSLRSTTVAFLNSKVVARPTADFILPLLIQTALIVSIIVSSAAGILSLFVSHHISGPLYRFKEVIEGLEKGEFTREFHIRHGDQLQDFAGALNSMLKKTREELSRLKINTASLKEKVSNISEGELSEGKRQALNEIKGLLSETDKIIGYFKA